LIAESSNNSPVSLRIDKDLHAHIKKYQEQQGVENRTLAINHLIKYGLQYYNGICGNPDDIPKEKFEMRILTRGLSQERKKEIMSERVAQLTDEQILNSLPYDEVREIWYKVGSFITMCERRIVDIQKLEGVNTCEICGKQARRTFLVKDIPHSSCLEHIPLLKDKYKPKAEDEGATA
jgi:hypothetical protein